jgi:hypothetical protein
LLKKKAPSCLKEGAFCGFVYIFKIPLAYLPQVDPGAGNNNGNNV